VGGRASSSSSGGSNNIVLSGARSSRGNSTFNTGFTTASRPGRAEAPVCGGQGAAAAAADCQGSAAAELSGVCVWGGGGWLASC
jgi:hypothetical protein